MRLHQQLIVSIGKVGRLERLKAHEGRTYQMFLYFPNAPGRPSALLMSMSFVKSRDALADFTLIGLNKSKDML